MTIVRLALAALLTIGSATSLAAQDAPPRHVQSGEEAIAQDAAQYAVRHGVDPAEASARLRAQEDSVSVTDRIARRYRERLAGISIEHAPEYRIVVLLTGSAPVAPRMIRAGRLDVPVLFRTGARATREQMAAAIPTHRDAIRAILPRAQGMGVDMRTGELVVVVQSALDPEGRPSKPNSPTWPECRCACVLWTAWT